MNPRFPHTEPFLIQGNEFSAQEIIERLAPLMREERRERLADIIPRRTYTVTPVLEGLYDRGNVSAVLRSAEALGFQSVHNIESSKKFKKANRVTQGAEKWLDIFPTESTAEGIAELRAKDYRILVTHFDDATPIEEVAFDQPTALVFGNEREGVSDEILEEADGRVVIPMLGFAQSFNISVAAALCLYHIYRDRVQRLGQQGDLTADEQRCLTASYYMRSVERAEEVLLQGA